MPKVVSLGVVFGLLAAWFIGSVHARDMGQWENSNPAIHEWYKKLTRPDAPESICCTEEDAYWADEFHVRDGKLYVTITDDRPDAPLGRPHIPNGSEFEVPQEKLKYDQSNPTGHGVLFINTSGFTWCFVMPGSV